VVEDRVLALGDAIRLLLQGDQVTVDDEEADKVARRADRQYPELEAAGPFRQRELPREVEERAGTTQPERRKAPQRMPTLMAPGAFPVAPGDR